MLEELVHYMCVEWGVELEGDGAGGMHARYCIGRKMWIVLGHFGMLLGNVAMQTWH